MILKALYPRERIVIFFTRMVGHKPLLYIIILIGQFWIFARRFKYIGVKRWPVGEHAGGSHRLKTWIKISPASSATQHSERFTGIVKEGINVSGQHRVNIQEHNNFNLIGNLRVKQTQLWPGAIRFGKRVEAGHRNWQADDTVV